MKKAIYILLTALVMAGCSTSRSLTKMPPSAAKPWTTWQAERVEATITLDGTPMWVNGSVQSVYDSVIVISVKPILGIEAFRIEFHQDEVYIIDRIAMRYTHPSYKYLNHVLKPHMSLQSLQHWLMEQNSGSDSPTPLSYKAMDKEGSISIRPELIILDSPIRVVPLRLETYQELSITEMLKQL